MPKFLIKRYIFIIIAIFLLWLGIDYLNVVTSFRHDFAQFDFFFLIVLFLIWFWANNDILQHQKTWLRVTYISLLTLLMVILSGLIIGGLVLMIHVSFGWKM